MLNLEPVATGDGPEAAFSLPLDFIEPPIRPGFDIIYGTWLDDCLCLGGEAGEKLIELASVRLSALKEDHFPKRRPPLLDSRLSCVLANALRAMFFRETNWVAFRRTKGAYVGRHPWVRPEGLATLIDGLAHAGLLETFPGHWLGCSSTYRSTDALDGLVSDCGAMASNIRRIAPSRGSLVVLRSGGDDRSELPYKRTAETKEWMDALERYNHFIEQHDVRLVLTPEEKSLYLKEEFEGRSSTNQEPGLIEPEFFNRHLYRIFNDGTWEHGGRFYRGWWQNVPSDLRKKITINGEATAELDYSGFLPRSIYHLNGIDYPRGDDPYVIPELVSYAVELGRADDYFRKATKTLLVALMNGDGELSHPERAKLKVSLLPRYSRLDVECMLAKMHPLLQTYFRTGEGKRNQRLDSDIASDVMSTMMERGILVLPVHDSFVIAKDFKHQLNELMIRTYRKHMGYDPVIK